MRLGVKSLLNGRIIVIFSVIATMNERFRHCISMSKMLNSDTLLADSGLDANSTAITADRILYNYAREQCQSAALDELFGNPADECFKVNKPLGSWSK